jgi:hypothetical protein
MTREERVMLEAYAAISSVTPAGGATVLSTRRSRRWGPA